MSEPVARASLDRWTALALLLPPAVLAWPGPGSLLADDFVPHATGAGAALLASLPAAVLLAWRPGAARPRGILLLALLGVVGAIAARSATDSFEVRRTAVHFAACLFLFCAGANLSADGLRLYARGTIGVSLALTLFALLDSADAFAGALGNTGSVAMAALPGALAGAVHLLGEKGAWRIASGLAVAAYLAYVIRAPVLAGGLAAGAGFAAFAIARWGRGGRGRGLAAAAAVLIALGGIGALALRSGADGSAGGVEVRTRVWLASLGMLRDHPWLGVGPGQFAAAFPPYRDPAEIELSTHHRAVPAETEVEHPHQDWLLPALELGTAGGVLWLAFLALVAGGAWRAMREDPPRAALGAAAIGVLAYALVHAPLSYTPASASIAFTAFGAVLARPGRSRAWPLLLLLLVAALPARAFVRHGSWLASLARPGERSAVDVERSIETALNCCHDSSVGTALLARFHEEKGSDVAVVARHWEGVLGIRPFGVEALMQLALARIRQGDLDAARGLYERARRLDPGHPGIARNLRLLDLQEGSFDAGREWLGGADPSPEECWARSKSERAGGDPILADLFEARAHLLWARQHAEAGRFGDAVRKFRQCLRMTLGQVEGGAPRVRLEFAAALAADGREEEARAQISGLVLRESDRRALPAWTGPWLGGLGAGK